MNIMYLLYLNLETWELSCQVENIWQNCSAQHSNPTEIIKKKKVKTSELNYQFYDFAWTKTFK